MTRSKPCDPVIALGAMTFGGQTRTPDAERMLDLSLIHI